MSKIKILIAADAALASALQADLEDCGYGVPAVAAAARAIGPLCRRHKPDLLVADAGLGAALGKCRIPVLLVAAKRRRARRRAIPADAQRLIYPCTKRELVTAVEGALPGSITELYRSHFESVSEIVFTVDRDLVLRSVSPSVRSILGYGPGELAGKRLSLRRFVPAAKARELMALFRRVLRGKSIGTVILDVRAKGGGTKTLEIKASRLLAAAGGPLVTGTARDISDWKHLTESLRDSEQRYRLLTETSPDMIFMLGPSGIVEYVNTVAARAFGRPYDQVIGKRVGDFFPKQIAKRQWGNIRKVFDCGKPVSRENQSALRGQAVWLDTWLVPVRDYRGAIVSVIGISRDITERKRMEQALRENEAKYRAHFDQASDGIIFMPVDGSRITANRSFARMHGYGNPAEMARLHLEDLDTPETAKLAPERLRRMMAGETLRFEVAHYHKDGHTIFLHVSCSVIRIGEQSFFLGFHRDITARKRAEQALRESEGKYRGLVETTDTGFVILDRAGRVIDANAEYVRLTGHRSLSQIRGRPVTRWTAPHDIVRNRAEVRKCLRSGSVRSLEIDYRHRNGMIVPVEINATVIKTTSGPQIVTLCRDITRRKQAEAELRASEERYRLLYNSINDSVFMHEMSPSGPGRILEVNDRVCERLGYSRDELLRMTVRDLDTPEQIRRIPKIDRELYAKRHALFETDHLTKDGRLVPMEVNIRLIKYQGRDAVLAVMRDITERRRAEQALRESEQISRAVSELTTDYSFIVDVDWRDGLTLRWTSVNLSPITGRANGEVATVARWRAVIHPGDLAAFTGFIKRTIATGAAGQLECRSLTKAMAERWIQIFAQPVCDGDGRVSSVIGAVKNITERKQAELALRDSEERYRTLVQNQAEGIGTVDQHERFIFSNPAADQIFGVAPRTLAGRSLREFTTARQFAVARRQTALRQQGIKSTFEIEIRRGDGQVRQLLVSAAPQPGRQGSYNGAFGVFRDITEWKRAEQALRESEAKFRSFIEQAAEGIVILDEQGRIAEWNRAQQRIYGLSREQTLGRYFWDVQYRLTPVRKRTAGQRQHYCRMVTHALRTGRSPIFDTPGSVTVNGPEGTPRYTEQRAFPIKTERGFRIGTVTMDVTEQKRLEQQMLEIGDRVQRQIGHDLHDGINQMLTVVALRLRALQQRLADQRAAEADDAATIAEMIKRTMTEVIGLSRGLSPLSLERGGIVLALKELAQTTAAAGVPCRASVDETVRLPDLAMATHLYRIAQEAVNNAVKHARAGRIEITLRHDRDLVRLDVADNGRGLRANAAAGTGMGLSLMRYRAGMIGAALELKDNPAGGTTVSCLFRAAEQ